MCDEITAKVLEEQVAGLRREMALNTQAATTANAKAEVALERRLDSVNQFREQLTHQAATFSTREQLETAEARIEAQLQAVDAKFRTLYESNRTEIYRLEKRLDEIVGEKTGSRRTVTAIYAAIGGCVAIVSMVVIVTNLLTSH